MKRKQILSVLLALALALSAFTIVPFAADDAWDGTTATQPAGSGTQEDPYQISSAANLLWMSQNIKKGDTVAEDAPEATDGTYGPSFAGVYFKQTCDIDLGGKSLPSIGYYYGNETRMAAFGGVYDGNGFTIRGGTIAATYDDCALEHDWGYGLFGVIYGAVIRKVYPEVRNGKFKADFKFSGVQPENIRTGQTYYMNLQLGQPEEAVIIPRGTFYQNTGGKWIYVVSPDGTRATRREIRIGRQNPQYYEVLEGLEPGEKVVISGYGNFGENEVLVF